MKRTLALITTLLVLAAIFKAYQSPEMAQYFQAILKACGF